MDSARHESSHNQSPFPLPNLFAPLSMRGQMGIPFGVLCPSHICNTPPPPPVASSTHSLIRVSLSSFLILVYLSFLSFRVLNCVKSGVSESYNNGHCGRCSGDSGTTGNRLIGLAHTFWRLIFDHAISLDTDAPVWSYPIFTLYTKLQERYRFSNLLLYQQCSSLKSGLLQR